MNIHIYIYPGNPGNEVTSETNPTNGNYPATTAHKITTTTNRLEF